MSSASDGACVMWFYWPADHCVSEKGNYYDLAQILHFSLRGLGKIIPKCSFVKAITSD